MSDVIAAEFGALDELSAEISTARGKVAQLQGDVNSNARTLSSHWVSSSASESWGAVQGNWDRACTDLTTALNALSQAVSNFRQQLMETEAGVAGLFHG